MEIIPKCPKCKDSPLILLKGVPIDVHFKCLNCGNLFGITELVNVWGYDLGDFGDITEYQPIWQPNGLAIIPLPIPLLDTESDEPMFLSKVDRNLAYEAVDRMFLGVPEWSVENYEADTGATHP